MKSNCKQLLALGALGGMIIALCVIILLFFGTYSSGIMAALSLVPIAISVLLVLPVFSICAMMIPVYANPLRANLTSREDKLYRRPDAPYEL